MPGPAPKDPDQRRRRNASLPLTHLPAAGRQGDPPTWPLPSAIKAERQMWAELWATPQAVVWEDLGWTRSVARYVRLTIQAEKRGAPVSLASEVRQMEDRLGLTPMSMLRLRWKVVDIAPPEVEGSVSDLDAYRAAVGGG